MKRQMACVGHIVRQEGLECDILKRECSGKQKRGRRRYWLMDSMIRWTGYDTDKLFESMMDRCLWRTVIADAVKHGT